MFLVRELRRVSEITEDSVVSSVSTFYVLRPRKTELKRGM